MGNCSSHCEAPLRKFEMFTEEEQSWAINSIISMIRASNAHADPVGFRIPSKIEIITPVSPYMSSTVLPLLKAMKELEVSRPYTVFTNKKNLTVAFVQNMTPKNFLVV